METIKAKALLVGAKGKFITNEEMTEALDMGIKALMKDTPQKIVYKYGCTYVCPPDCGGAEFDEYGDIPHCPSCDYEFSKNLNECFHDYCHKCGQKLEWK